MSSLPFKRESVLILADSATIRLRRVRARKGVFDFSRIDSFTERVEENNGR